MRSLYVDAKNRERITSQYLEEALESVALPIARDLLVRLSHELDPHRTTREENEPGNQVHPKTRLEMARTMGSC